MKEYDAIVIGSGAGMIIAEKALNRGMKVALVDRGPLGGTCLNLGCIPSKMMIYPADRIVEIQEASKLGVRADVVDVDFAGIMGRMRKTVREDRQAMEQALLNLSDLDLFRDEARFVDEYTLEIGKERIRGRKIFIACGARPAIPPLKGLETVPFLTNESVLDLERLPESLIILGGGYIAAEYGHFFSAMGTHVSIVERDKRFLKREEPEISDLVTKKLGERMTIRTGVEATEARLDGEGVAIVGRKKQGKKSETFRAEKILVATGRRSNADLLEPQKTGVETDKNGYIVVDETLRTTKKNIWALGDAIGKAMFRHAANYEAELVIHNAFNTETATMDFLQVPHAVFTCPEIASVGMTEAEALKLYEDDQILVGYAKYSDTARGLAMMETDGFAKALVENENGVLLGFHIIGPHASILLQEVINAASSTETLLSLMSAMHIHPALPELIQRTIQNLIPLEQQERRRRASANS